MNLRKQPKSSETAWSSDASTNTNWNQIEEYIRNHSEADFSHGLCPPCIEKLYPDYTINKSYKNKVSKELSDKD